MFKNNYQNNLFLFLYCQYTISKALLGVLYGSRILIIFVRFKIGAMQCLIEINSIVDLQSSANQRCGSGSFGQIGI